MSVAEILGKPGNLKEIRVSKELPGIRHALASLTDNPIEGDLKAESVVEGILVTGSLRGKALFECARCLTDTSSQVAVDVCELFVAPGHEAPPEEDAYKVQGLEIDLEPMIRDALALALPLNPLCREECQGMCAQCGRDLNQGPCGCVEDELDPRWAALSELRDKLA